MEKGIAMPARPGLSQGSPSSIPCTAIATRATGPGARAGDDRALAAWRHLLGGHRQADADRDRDQGQSKEARGAADKPPAVCLRAAAVMGRTPRPTGMRRPDRERAEGLDRAVVVDHHSAEFGQDRPGALGAGQQGRLGKGLGLHGGVRAEGGGADQTRPRRAPGTGSSRWWA